MFAVHTKETVNGADLSYTIRATAHWDWNGFGPVTVNPVGGQYDWSRYVWTSSFANGHEIRDLDGRQYRSADPDAGTDRPPGDG